MGKASLLGDGTVSLYGLAGWSGIFCSSNHITPHKEYWIRHEWEVACFDDNQ